MGILSQDDGTNRVPIVIFIGVAICLVIVWIVIQMGVGDRAETRPPELSGLVVFIGSSTIARFPLEMLFPSGKGVDLGKPDENAVDMRARVARDLPDDARPAGIVLYAGSYDLRKEPGLSTQDIRDRVDHLVGDLRSRFPETPILLLQVLPGRAQSAEERAAVVALNSELDALAGRRGAFFIKTNRPPLADANGDLSESMSVDRFHLNEAGYRILAKWIQDDGGAVGALLR